MEGAQAIKQNAGPQSNLLATTGLALWGLTNMVGGSFNLDPSLSDGDRLRGQSVFQQGLELLSLLVLVAAMSGSVPVPRTFELSELNLQYAFNRADDPRFAYGGGQQVVEKCQRYWFIVVATPGVLDWIGGGRDYRSDLC